MIDADAIRPFLTHSLQARLSLLDERHEPAVRLFNGFVEGCPQLVVELFGAPAVLYKYADPPAELDEVVPGVVILPDAARRVRQYDRYGIGRFAARMAPATCLAMDPGARLTFRAGRLTTSHAARLTPEGDIDRSWAR